MNHTTKQTAQSEDIIAISLKNVSKYYKLYDSPKDRLKEALSLTNKKYHKKFYAANNISLKVKKGEILGIIGKNGSGKSTLLKLITGVLTPDNGNIETFGKISALLELGSGFNPKFTGIENIFFYGLILGLTKKEMDNKLEEIIAFAEIDDFIYQPLKTYSSGMRTRLAFAVAIHIDPEILILDEILSVGDVLFKRKSYAKMEEFFKKGKTIIYVSHNTNSVMQLCTRVVFLLDGKIIMDGDPNTVTKHYEKYLFAKNKNQQKVKDEILNFNWNNIIEHQNNIQTQETPIQPSLPEEKDKQMPFFIPDFISKNQVEYDNRNLDIYDICIKTMDGKKVNALVMYKRYRYCYKLQFKKDFNNVGFGMQIHTQKGIVVCSCGTRQCKPKKTIEQIKKGSVLEVEWEFDCLIHKGIYYTNTGVNHIVKDNRAEFINRITDAFVFKVLESKSCCDGGLVSLNQTISSFSALKES